MYVITTVTTPKARDMGMARVGAVGARTVGARVKRAQERQRNSGRPEFSDAIHGMLGTRPLRSRRVLYNHSCHPRCKINPYNDLDEVFDLATVHHL